MNLLMITSLVAVVLALHTTLARRHPSRRRSCPEPVQIAPAAASSW